MEQFNTLEESLKGLIKLIRAVQYYPPRHPSLETAVNETLSRFLPLLKDRTPLTCTVRKEGFLLGDRHVAPDNALLKKFAPYLFARRIHHITFLPDLSPPDLEAFARCLALESEQLRKMGGILKALREAGVSTIRINEIDLSRVMTLREDLEAGEEATTTGEEPETTVETRESRNLERVLLELAGECSEERFASLLAELAPLVRLNLTDAGRTLVVRALIFLSRAATDRETTENRRNLVRQALTRLTSPDVVDFLVESLCQERAPEKTQDGIVRLLALFGEKSSRRLMEKLASGAEGRYRKKLTRPLLQQGTAAVPILIEYLADERVRAVRGSMALLGEIRDPAAAPYLHPMLYHQNIQIRREAVAALTRIGGLPAVGILLRALTEADRDLRCQILGSLGTIGNPAAVGPLRKLLRRPDPFGRNAEVKKAAIRALGGIGGDESVPPLRALLRRRPIWRRTRFDEIRALAALSLGKIAGPKAETALETAAKSRSAVVARAATQALSQIRKERPDETGNS